MKRKVLAMLVPALLVAGAANAAEIYNKNGNKVDFYGKMVGERIWVMSRIPDAPVSGFESDLGSTAGKWLGALVGFLFMALVGALLGGIAWYTRPRPARCRRYE